MSDETFTQYDGVELTVLERPAGPGGRLVMRFVLPDGCGSPPAHIHPKCDETFSVQEGSFDLRLEKEWTPVAAGETVTVAAGRPHTFRNRSGARAVIENIHDPHHEFEAFIREIAALTHEARSGEPRTPMDALKAAMIFGRYPDLIQPADRPMKLAFPALRAIGRLTRVSLPAPA